MNIFTHTCTCILLGPSSLMRKGHLTDLPDYGGGLNPVPIPPYLNLQVVVARAGVGEGVII